MAPAKCNICFSNPLSPFRAQLLCPTGDWSVEDEAVAAPVLASIGADASMPAAALLRGHPILLAALARPFPLLPCTALQQRSQVGRCLRTLVLPALNSVVAASCQRLCLCRCPCCSSRDSALGIGQLQCSELQRTTQLWHLEAGE